MLDDNANRRAGVLLHITSLPSGRMDDDALRWLDFMSDCGLTLWQVLPLVIPDGTGSPYQSPSAFACDPRLLPRHDTPVNVSEFETFCGTNSDWLDDFALYQILKQRFDGHSWVSWPDPFRHRDSSAIRQIANEAANEIAAIKEQQYRLDRAWHKIRGHADDLGIKLFGDIPIFIAHDSADTWSDPQDFMLDEEGQPTFVTGVPPDYFAEFGQRWGNPHYCWECMLEDGFAWWIKRMERQFALFDLVRIDHFRGLSAVWMIAASCPTAVEGYWKETPGDALLDALKKRFPRLPIVAEDLGVITEEVRELRDKYELPGMAVLQFAFDNFDDNPHKPSNIRPNNVTYTGTHDNDTCVGWFNSLLPHEREFVFSVLKTKPTNDIAQLMIETAMQSNANLAIVPLQDFLRLGSEARMNTPGVTEGNWRWRFTWEMLRPGLADWIKTMIDASDRNHAR